MLHEVNWKIGGVQGEGIDSTGDIMALVCNRLGYHIYSNRVCSSRIKGGHISAEVRIATRPVAAPVEETHVLVALDQESIDKSAPELSAGSCVIADSAFKPSLPSEKSATLIALPLTALAREIQGPILKNTVAFVAAGSRRRTAAPRHKRQSRSCHGGRRRALPLDGHLSDHSRVRGHGRFGAGFSASRRRRRAPHCAMHFDDPMMRDLAIRVNEQQASAMNELLDLVSPATATLV